MRAISGLLVICFALARSTSGAVAQYPLPPPAGYPPPAFYPYPSSPPPPYPGAYQQIQRPPADVRWDRAPPGSALAALPPKYQPEPGAAEELPPQLRRVVVDYPTIEPPGTIIIDTPHTYLYLTLGHGKAIRYGIGVGREGFTESGTERISQKERMAGLVSAEADDCAPTLPTAVHGWRRNQSTWSAGNVSRQHGIPHSRHQ